MRPIKLIWGIGGTLLVALLIGCYFYQRSNEMMRVESKNLFIQALKGEMLRKGTGSTMCVYECIGCNGSLDQTFCEN